MNKIFYFFWIILIIFSCQQEKRINISDIKIPTYYKEYNYKKFWESKGMDFNFSDPNIFQKKFYKDSISQNFLSLGEEPKSIIKLDRNNRINEFINNSKYYDAKLKYGIKNNIEYYIIKFNFNLKGKKVSNIDTHLIFLNDSLHLSLNFTSFQNGEKRKDYFKLLDSIIR